MLTLTFSGLCKLNAQSNSRTDHFMDSLMKKEHVPGLAYAVVKEGTVISTGTLGKAAIPYNIPVNRATVFQLASTSKIFCSLLLARLFDQYLLKPGDPISKYIDSVPKEWEKINILQLASHQSGIKISDYSKTYHSKKAVDIAKKLPIEYEPGSRSSYVSSDYWVLQYIIEKVTGLKYFAALTKMVLTPLGLTHTFVNNPKTGYFTDLDIIPEIAQEYHWFNEDSTLRINQMWFSESGYTAGGIYSSIDDMIKLAQVFDKGNFLSAASRALITRPAMLNDGKPGYYGLGLIVTPDYQGHYLVEHSGGPALADFVRFEKEKLTVIVLTNNRGLYPYFAKSLATLFVPGLAMPEIPKGWR